MHQYGHLFFVYLISAVHDNHYSISTKFYHVLIFVGNSQCVVDFCIVAYVVSRQTILAKPDE